MLFFPCDLCQVRFLQRRPYLLLSALASSMTFQHFTAVTSTPKGSQYTNTLWYRTWAYKQSLKVYTVIPQRTSQLPHSQLHLRSRNPDILLSYIHKTLEFPPFLNPKSQGVVHLNATSYFLIVMEGFQVSTKRISERKSASYIDWLSVSWCSLMPCGVSRLNHLVDMAVSVAYLSEGSHAQVVARL